MASGLRLPSVERPATVTAEWPRSGPLSRLLRCSLMSAHQHVDVVASGRCQRLEETQIAVAATRLVVEGEYGRCRCAFGPTRELVYEHQGFITLSPETWQLVLPLTNLRQGLAKRGILRDLHAVSDDETRSTDDTSVLIWLKIGETPSRRTKS